LYFYVSVYATGLIVFFGSCGFTSYLGLLTGWFSAKGFWRSLASQATWIGTGMVLILL